MFHSFLSGFVHLCWEADLHGLYASLCCPLVSTWVQQEADGQQKVKSGTFCSNLLPNKLIGIVILHWRSQLLSGSSLCIIVMFSPGFWYLLPLLYLSALKVVMDPIITSPEILQHVLWFLYTLPKSVAFIKLYLLWLCHVFVCLFLLISWLIYPPISFFTSPLTFYCSKIYTYKGLNIIEENAVGFWLLVFCAAMWRVSS